MALTTRNAEMSCNFLNLSAELRNHIYDFAIAAEIQDTPSRGLLLQHTTPKPYATRTWKFFGFTQTCKQIRVEFRSLWMRSAAVQFISVETAIPFISTFMPTDAELKHAPKMFDIGWDSDSDSKMVWHEITCILRIRAFCPSFCWSFAPLDVVRGLIPSWEEICPCCQEHEDSETGYLLEGTEIPEDCICHLKDEDTEDWVQEQYEEIDYMNVIPELGQATKQAWLEDLREKKISVRFSFNGDTGRVRICIICKKEAFKNISSHQPVQKLFEKWGICNLERRKEVRWILECKEKQRSKDGNPEMEVSTKYQVRFRRPGFSV